jgi:thioredoxin 1
MHPNTMTNIQEPHRERGNMLIFGVVALAIIGIAAFFLVPQKQDAMMVSDQAAPADSEAMMENGADTTQGDDAAMMEQGTNAEQEDGGAMMEATGTTLDGTDSMMASDTPSAMGTDIVSDHKVAGTYEAYAPEKLANAKDGKVVLFFHATWCPTCKAADTNLKASTIPAGLTILKTDYDTETALKQKYGITYQHVFVQVDAQGNLLKKWSGSTTLAAIQAELI